MNILYIRQSKDSNNAAESLAGQEQECLYHAEQTGFSFDLILRDTISGQFTIGERPQGKVLLDYIRQGEIKSLTMPSVDRLSRDTWGESDLALMIDLLREHSPGALWYFADNHLLGGEMVPFEYSDDTQVLHVKTQLQASALERINITKRTMRKKHAMLREGKPVLTGKYPPYGYEYIWEGVGKTAERKRIIDKARAQTVKRIFDLYTREGKTASQIATVLNEEQALTPAGHVTYTNQHGNGKVNWSTTKIYKILGDKTYCGYYIWGKHKHSKKDKTQVLRKPGEAGYFEIEAEDQKVIDLGTWEQAQKITKENRVVRSPREWLLRGYLFCECGEHYIGNGKYYRCNSSKHKTHKCGNASVRKDDIEDTIWEMVKHLITNPQNLHNAFSASLEEQTTRAQERKLEAGESRRVLDAKGREIDNLAYSIGKAEGERTLQALLKRSQVLEQEYQAIEAEVLALEAEGEAVNPEEINEQAAYLVFEYTNKLENADYQTKRNLLSDLGVKVIKYLPITAEEHQADYGLFVSIGGVSCKPYTRDNK